MPLNLVLFQLPNMSIYFNQILAAAAILYILYFFIQQRMLDMDFKEHIKDNQLFAANLFINCMRLFPIMLVIFAMYNIDNQQFNNGMKINECYKIVQDNERNNIMNRYNNSPQPFFDINMYSEEYINSLSNISPITYSTRIVHGVEYNFSNEAWEYIDNGTRP